MRYVMSRGLLYPMTVPCNPSIAQSTGSAYIGRSTLRLYKSTLTLLKQQGSVIIAGAASTPIFGVLRKMTTAAIANRLNWSAYKDLGVTPFQSQSGAFVPGGTKRDSNVVMGSPQPTLDSFFKKKPRTQ